MGRSLHLGYPRPAGAVIILYRDGSVAPDDTYLQIVPTAAEPQPVERDLWVKRDGIVAIRVDQTI